jgi:hypothetical protein
MSIDEILEKIDYLADNYGVVGTDDQEEFIDTEDLRKLADAFREMRKNREEFEFD